MSKCWYCNEELTTANYCEEHIGICTKCYGSMFKVGNEFVKSLTDKIADLEAKLAESEEKYNACQEARKLEIEFNRQDKVELKQQLAEKEHELDIRTFEAEMNAITITKMRESKHQDKISFCIEQLEKVKNKFNGKRPIDDLANEVGLELGYTATQIQKYIDNQIKQLKEGE